MTLPVETIKFDSDTAERKKLFTAASFSHPAKMHLSLQVYLVERYTKAGDTILDPMAGSGTLLAACALGRNVILVELEQKFCKMMVQNWLKIKSLGPMLGYKMGEAIILRGDARNLDGLLADNILFSPPYAEALDRDEHKHSGGRVAIMLKDSYLKSKQGKTEGQIGNLPYGEISAVISSPPYAHPAIQAGHNPEKLKELYKQGRISLAALKKNLGIADSELYKGYGKNPENIGNLPYKADAVITSPPYEQSISGKELDESEKLIKRKSGKEKWGKHLRLGRSQLTKYADAVITSPPYEAQGFKCDENPANVMKREAKRREKFPMRPAVVPGRYGDTPDNIGNLKSENYLEAMLSVYQNCHKVLKEKGLLVLVVKNFIRDKKIIRLDLDTIKICEKAGFTLKERLKRKLTQQSFWRTIYYNKFPDVEKIEYEDILVFQRAKARPDGFIE